MLDARQPPIRVIVPGRTYRRDSDQTHTPMFHQVEGLVIDKALHMGHLKWMLRGVLQGVLRGRPAWRCASARTFFPFTEPSPEVDIQCDRSGGEIRIGEGEDWLEILGCGMVHPNVLRNCGLDPDEYQGFAWGMGIDRLAMLKYGMPDLRDFFDADVRWLSHYGFRPLDLPILAGGLSVATVRERKQMKFTLSWLKDHLDTDAHRSSRSSTTLTMVGLEVEDVEDQAQAARAFSRRLRDRRPSSTRTPTACGSARSTPGRRAPCRSSAARPTRARA